MLKILRFVKKTSLDNATEFATDNRFEYISRSYCDQGRNFF
jgi:hypothetical protein